MPFRKDLRGPWGIGECFTSDERVSFRDILLGALTRYGGDFQNARFTGDTYIRVERRGPAVPGQKGYSVHVWERLVSELPDCADLVDLNATAGDFSGDC